MGVLSSVIRYKELENMERQTNQQTVANIFGSFQKARQTSLLLDMEKQKVDASLAKSGLRVGQGGKVEADEGLMDKLGLVKSKEWKPGTKEEAFEFEALKKTKGLSQSKRSIIGDIRAAKSNNASLEDIQTMIKYEGYKSEDFADELEGYNPLTFDEKESPVNKRNIFGIGQKYDKRVKNGTTYERRGDNLWHPVS